MAKYGMSLCVLGMAEEFRADGIACQRAVAADGHRDGGHRVHRGAGDAVRRTRKPEIMADAAHAILTRDARACTGNFFIDDEVLREAGVTDFSIYRQEGVSEDALMPDFFL